ncbi:MAG: hypothetical protein IPJ21_11880 [Sterolibacteriaceae bacterium]|nr:hypothetical protein [Sterolibacteriaceae bacterium]MBK9084553.1 hypothetical protein [Sterolibacteriaceae bacterium]
MKRKLPAFAILLGVLASAPAPAQMLSPDYATFGAPMSNYLSTSHLSQRVMNDLVFAGGKKGKATKPAAAARVTFKSDRRPPVMPARLAQGYPAAKRAEVERVFTALLTDVYPKIEKHYAMPPNDLAGAVATFLVGSYEGANDTVLEDPPIKATIAQVRGVLAANPQIAQAADADKREMFEQMAIIGTFMASVKAGLQTAPNPALTASMQKAGADYLRTFLGVDPAQVRIDERGLTVTDGPQSATAAVVVASSASPATPAGKPVGSSAAALVGAIATVGFDTKTSFGYGGALTFDPTPIVLFKSGDALRDMEALKAVTDVATHKAAHPKQWTTWRRAGKAIEILNPKGWEKLTYTKTMGPLPHGFLLDTNYQRLSGTGNLAVGGTSAVAVWSSLQFDRSGGFVSGGGSSASARADGASSSTSVVTQGRAPDRSGRYAIDGYTLTLSYADGRVERRMIVTEADDPGVIWLDGDGYTSR